MDSSGKLVVALQLKVKSNESLVGHIRNYQLQQLCLHISPVFVEDVGIPDLVMSFCICVDQPNLNVWSSSPVSFHIK